MAELKLIIGPMYSGKTFALIRELDVAGIAERRVPCRLICDIETPPALQAGFQYL